MDDLLTEFITETSESLALIDSQMVEFEKDPNNKEILGNIFRLVHTIKGTCGFLGLPRLEKVAHAGENVLDKFRDGNLEVTPDAVTLILRCIDTIRDLMDELESSGSEPEGDDQELIDTLNALASGKSAQDASLQQDTPVEDTGAPPVNEHGAPVAAELLAEVEAAEAAGMVAASDSQMAAEDAAQSGGDASNGPSVNEHGAPVAAELLAEVEAAQASGVVAASDAQIATDMQAENATTTTGTAHPAAPKPRKVKAAKKANAKETGNGAKEGSVAASSIRVNVDLLEGLMTLVSELVLTRNQLLQMVRGHDDSDFHVPLQRLSHITTDLQEGVMKTRMQPIGNAWAKLPRIVRDLAIETGKKIELQMLGAETELDRQVLELIKDPLTHMVRNSADHGLEDPEGRAAAGKPEMGSVILNAYHEGGHIIIEIADDGRGLNMDRICAKITENGLASDTELESMTDEQIQQFIFRAGFSTAEKVTSVSGRGVGMDVVRTNIEKIGGTVELKSVEGKGSTFTIKIPLTLAIVSALIVACGGERFAIPQISVLELVRASGRGENKLEIINNSPVLRLRNRLLPLVPLRDMLKLNNDEKEAEAEDAASTEEKVKALIAKKESAISSAASALAEAESRNSILEEKISAARKKVQSAEKAAAAADQSLRDAEAIEDFEPGVDENEAAVQRATRKSKIAVATAAAEQAGDALKDAKADEATVMAEMDEVAEAIEAAGQANEEAAAMSIAADQDEEELFIIVSQVGMYTFGIIVDQVFDTEEIVVKPVAPILRDIPFYSGNTILGDGSVIMILDPNGIASATGQISGKSTDHESKAMTASHEEEKTTLLIFTAGGSELKAVPLALIARLEEIDTASVEKSHGQHVVQYRGHLMPLIPFDADHEWKNEGRQPILVFTDHDRSMGLVVDQIVDIVEDKLDIEISAAGHPGLIGSAVIAGKATDIMDAGYYLTQAFTDWFGNAEGDTGEQNSKRVLLVDDSSFFRNLLTPLLSAAGYKVTTVEGADDALKLRESGVNFDAIVTDIEMPGMTGFEFASAVHGDSRWQDIPMIALSSHATNQDFERGRDVGFSDYVAKFDRDALVATLAQTVATAVEPAGGNAE